MEETQLINNERLFYGRVNTCIGSLQLRLFSNQQVAGAFAILATWPLLVFVFQLSLEKASVVCFTLFVVFLVWGGSDYTKQLERMRKPRTYKTETAPSTLKAGIPSIQLLERTKEDKSPPGIIREFYLRTYGSYDKDNSESGFYILNKGGDVYSVFGFKVGGFSPSMTDSQAYEALTAIEKVLASIPNIEFKLYWDVRSSAEGYHHQQAELLNAKAHDPLSEAVIVSRGKRATRLQRQGKIVTSELRVYARFKVVLGGDYAEAQNWQDKELAKVLPVLQRTVSYVTEALTPVDQRQVFEQEEARSWRDAIDHAYGSCCLPTLRLLTESTGMGIKADVLSVHELFQRDWDEIHSLPVDKCPKYIQVTPQGITEISDNSDLHILPILYCPEEKQSVPQFFQSSVYLPAKRKWAGCLKIGQQLEFPAESDGSQARGNMRYLLRALEGVSDFRLISETVAIDPVDQTKELNRGTKNRTRRVEDATTRQHTTDVAAGEDLVDLVEARRLVRSGKRTTSIATCIWVYRDTEAQVEEALRQLSNIAFPGERSQICQSLMHRRWIDSQPYAWFTMFAEPYVRREDYMTSQAIPLLPLTQPQPIDKQGLLFTGRDIPIACYLDLIGKKNHTGIFAKSGGGKSLIGLEVILECIFTNTPALILDSPRGTGESTYTPVMEALASLGVKCDYHNIRAKNLNIIGFNPGPAIDPDTAQNHINILTAIVIGSDHKYILRGTIESILAACHRDFFQSIDPWTDKPILEDFYRFFLEWTIQYKETEHPEQKELDAISDIRIQLKGCLASPWGQRLNAQTSFNPDVQVLTLGLTNAQEDSKETLVYALAGLALLDQQAAKSARSLFIIDEGTTLIGFDAVASKFARTFSEGRKMGRNGLFLATDLDKLWDSPYSQAIFANFDNILCGYTNLDYVPKFVKHVGFKNNILSRYTQRPDLRQMRSDWYLKRGNEHIELQYSTTPLLLALGATEPDEAAARERVLACYADRLEGYQAFATALARAYSQGLSAKTIR